MSSQRLNLINMITQSWNEKQVCNLPSAQIIHMTDARPPAAPPKKKRRSDLLQKETSPCVRIYSREEWLTCLFLCRRDNCIASFNNSRQPAVSCCQRCSSTTLPFLHCLLLNNANRCCEWKKLADQCKLVRNSLSVVAFCIQAAWSWTHSPLISLSFTPFLQYACAHVCGSTRRLKHHEGIGSLPPPPPLSHKCEGIVNISAADGADAPSLPPSRTQGGQSKWIAINSSRSRPRPRLEQRTQGLDCCSGRQFYRQIPSDYQQGDCTALAMRTYEVIISKMGRQASKK